MIPFPQPKRFAERGSGLLAGASDVTRSTDPFSLLAARHGTRLPFSLQAGLLFSLAGIGSLSDQPAVDGMAEEDHQPLHLDISISMKPMPIEQK